jgi:hypothetical protein
MRPVATDRFVVNRPGGGEEVIAVGLDVNGRADYIQMNVWALARTTRPPGSPTR